MAHCIERNASASAPTSRASLLSFASLAWFGRALLLTVLLVAASPTRARADGAFPDSMALLVPAGAPHRIVLATNFGLLVTEDDGAHWGWVCEDAIALLPFQYQVGPSGAYYSLNYQGVSTSTDLCSWTRHSLGPPAAGPIDLFPDPSNAMHVLTIGRLTTTTTTAAPTSMLFESKDGGVTFSVLAVAPTGSRFESVEIARASSARIYAVVTQGQPPARIVRRSNDGGAHWIDYDQTSTTGGRLPLIAAVDPDDQDTIYFRIVGNSDKDGDALAISHDGGATLRVTYKLSTAMSSFLRRPSAPKTLIVGTLGGGYISHDGGATFVAWSNAVHPRALAERNGAIYAAADNFGDGFAVGSTTDEGNTWKPLGRYDQIQGPLSCGPVMNACLKCRDGDKACDSPWQQLQNQFGIDAGTAGDASESTDAGAPGADGGTPRKSGGGSSCSAAGGVLEVGSPWSAVVLAAVALLCRRSRAAGAAMRPRGPSIS